MRKPNSTQGYIPPSKSLCLCGSGKKFKRCCSGKYSGRSPGVKTRDALNRNSYPEALEECRADITQYTIWHKSHTEPLVRLGIKEIEPLMEIDLKALAELVELLSLCYLKSNHAKDFPATLDRLRNNIEDPRWQRKIIYFRALFAAIQNNDGLSGKQELRKLGSIKSETDVEILQLYIDLFGGELTFSEKQNIIDKIVSLSDKKVDRLHYRGLRAVQLLIIGDERGAENELSESITEFRGAASKEDMSSYEIYRLAHSLELLGAIRKDVSLLNETLALYKRMLESDDLTPSGKANIYKQIGDTHRHKKDWIDAFDAYSNAHDVYPLGICIVFKSECMLYLNKIEKAIELITTLDRKELDQNEYVDYVFCLAAIAIHSANNKLLIDAETALRNLDIRVPLFREMRDSLLLNVVETKKSGASLPTTTRTITILEKISRAANRYFLLEPNIFGIGINFNRIIDDLKNSSEHHQSSSTTINNTHKKQ